MDSAGLAVADDEQAEAHRRMAQSPEQILVFDKRGFQGPLFLFGVLLLLLSAGLLWAG